MTKKRSSPKKIDYTKPAMATVGAIALAGLTGMSINKLLKNNSKEDLKTSKVNFDDCEIKLKKLSDILRNEISIIDAKLKQEREQNKKLVEQIRQCNKEVLRQKSVISMRPSLHKEATLRNTIKKLMSKKN